MLRNISLVFVVAIISAIFQSLIFIKLANKVSKKKIMDPLYEIIGSIILVVFNCFSFIYLYQFGYWVPNTLFVMSCIIYLIALSRNHFIENVVLSLTYYITFWFITYAIYYFFNSLNMYAMPLSNFVLDYVATAIALAIIYVVASKVMPIMIDYKEHELTILQFSTLMFFGLVGFISLVLYNNGFSIALGAVCNFSILMLSLYINDKQDSEKEKQGLIEKNEFLTEQDKMVRAVSDEKYMDKLVIV